MPIIFPTTRALTPAASAPRGRTGSTFSVALDAPATARLAAPEGVASLSALIGLQSDYEPVEDREARRHGQDLLAELAGLHRALLGEASHPELLHTLDRLVATPLAPARDPRLADAVAAIRLRAMVELARYTTDR
jgi:hypothetical protein